MNRMIKWFVRLIDVLVICCLSNYISLREIGCGNIFLLCLMILLFLWLNIDPSIANHKIVKRRLRICGNGCELLMLFCITTSVSVVYSILGFCGVLSLPSLGEEPKMWLFNALLIFGIEVIVFWNGIIRVYLTSEQLGIRWRVIGILCGWIPIAHLIALGIIIKTVSAEVQFENDKILLNRARHAEQICATKYPILLVHGVFFRDFRYLNYWGRIPKQLEENGAVIYYGQQQSASSVESCGKELGERILQIVKETGCEKVNIIGHSKGGLDSRYAASLPEVAPHIASITTINTPHRGCEFADYLLGKIPEKQKQHLASAYNKTLRKLGDHDPDFIEAVTDLTSESCKKRNEVLKDTPGILYQSFGSKLKRATGGRFPLNFSYPLVHYFDGANDGLVGESSFPWGETFQFLEPKGNRGISHGDIIDLNRENIAGFDVREFYVQLVSDLKKRGY